MLKQAILYEEKLKREYLEAICDDDQLKFYNSSSYRTFNFQVVDTDCWKIQLVSVDTNDNLIGYISADIDRDSRVVSSFGIMNFTKVINIIFSKDLMNFMKSLRDKCNASKFEFCAFAGGKPEQMYRRFINKYGGRVVGTYTSSSKLLDGKYYDLTLFEVMRKDMKF
jgi:hypothetical protein